MSIRIEIPIGTKIGRLTVIGKGEPKLVSGKMASMTIVQCSCEAKTVKEIPTMYLTKKRPILSCGCAKKMRVNHVEAKHAPRISKGYRYVYAPNSVGAKTSGSYKGYVFEHRLIMEKHIGRPLTDNEDVHHIDFNPLNNDITNLMLLSKCEHSRLHHFLKGNIIKKEDCYDKTQVIRILQSPPRKCKDCGVPLSVIELSHSEITRCPKCAMKHLRKVQRPTREELISLLSGDSVESVARRFGVTGNAVRKWCLNYCIEAKNYTAKRTFSEEARRMSLNPESIAKRVKSQKEWYLKHGSPCRKSVVCLTKDMKVVKEYSTIADALSDGFIDTCISRCCKGKRATYKGYVWRYKDEVA